MRQENFFNIILQVITSNEIYEGIGLSIEPHYGIANLTFDFV